MLLLLYAISLALAIGGAWALAWGIPMIVLERGWTWVISGSVYLTGAAIVFALAMVVRALRQLPDMLEAGYADDSAAGDATPLARVSSAAGHKGAAPVANAAASEPDAVTPVAALARPVTQNGTGVATDPLNNVAVPSPAASPSVARAPLSTSQTSPVASAPPILKPTPKPTVTPTVAPTVKPAPKTELAPPAPARSQAELVRGGVAQLAANAASVSVSPGVGGVGSVQANGGRQSAAPETAKPTIPAAVEGRLNDLLRPGALGAPVRATGMGSVDSVAAEARRDFAAGPDAVLAGASRVAPFASPAASASPAKPATDFAANASSGANTSGGANVRAVATASVLTEALAGSLASAFSRPSANVVQQPERRDATPTAGGHRSPAMAPANAGADARAETAQPAREPVGVKPVGARPELDVKPERDLKPDLAQPATDAAARDGGLRTSAGQMAGDEKSGDSAPGGLRRDLSTLLSAGGPLATGPLATGARRDELAAPEAAGKLAKPDLAARIGSLFSRKGSKADAGGAATPAQAQGLDAGFEKPVFPQRPAPRSAASAAPVAAPTPASMPAQPSLTHQEAALASRADASATSTSLPRSAGQPLTTSAGGDVVFPTRPAPRQPVADAGSARPAVNAGVAAIAQPAAGLAEGSASEPASAPDAAPTVVGSYTAGGTLYVMYSDGSIEAQTENGVQHFPSLDALKAHVGAGKS